MSADGVGTNAIMAATDTSKTTVDGLFKDKTRPPGSAPVDVDHTAEVVRLTLEPPPHEATDWTARAMAATAGLAVSTVQKIWKAHGLAPHRWRAFKLSADPAFAEKLHAIVGLYVKPAGARGRALDRREEPDPGARPQPARPAAEEGSRRDHDTRLQAPWHHALFAALNVIGRNMQRHRHQEFIRFLNEIEKAVPAGKVVYAILDNYAAHKHLKVRAWLERHPRWVFHFTPTSSFWLNAVEGFFAKLSRRRLKHGIFRSIADLQAAINRFIAEHNDTPKPFVWRADPDDIIAARARGY